jgi:hypothetical protein
MIKIMMLCFVMLFTPCLTLASPQDAGREAAALKVKKLARKFEKTVRERKERWLPEKMQLAGTNIYIRWTSGKKALAITTDYQPTAEDASRVLQFSATTISAPHITTAVHNKGEE